MGSQQTINNPSLYNANVGYSTFWLSSEYYTATVVPFMAGGNLMATWTDNNKNVQVGNLNATVSTPTQQSLAGFSIDGNIDVNGDGFKDVLISDPSKPSESVDNQYVLFGGDFLNIASQVGTAGNDTMLGTPLADVIYTLGGSDGVQSKGGGDVIYTGSGDDQIAIADNGFLRIDAGSGFDQLLLQGQADQSYDFRLDIASPQYFVGTRLQNIELISSIDYGSNAIYLDAAAINAINPDRVLFLTPDAVDTISLSSEFVPNSTFDATYSGTLWYAYAAGSAGATNPALVYVRVPEGETASTWLQSQVAIGSQNPQPTLMSSALVAPEPKALPLDVADPVLSVLPLSSSSPSLAASAPPISTGVVSAANPATSPSMVAGSSNFGDGLTITAYRTTPNSGVARFRISRNEVSQSQLISYVSSSLNSSAEPGLHYTPVAGLLRLDKGQSFADVSVPVDAAAIAALRTGLLSLQVQELPDIGQEPFHLLLENAPDSRGLRPVLSSLNLEVDAKAQRASLSFRTDTSQPAANANSSPTSTLTVIRRASSDGDSTDPKNRRQTLRINDAIDGKARYDLDQNANNQLSLSLALDLTTGNASLQALNAPDLLLSNLDPNAILATPTSNYSLVEINSRGLDPASVTSLNKQQVSLNGTAIDLQLNPDSAGRARLTIPLAQVGGDLQLVDANGQRLPQRHLTYYGVDTNGQLLDLSYNPVLRAGGRFYDTSGDGRADTLALRVVDGGYGDKDGKVNGVIDDPSLAASVDLNPTIAPLSSYLLQVGDSSSDKQQVAASLRLLASLSQRPATVNQVGYIVLASNEDEKSAVFSDLASFRERAATLFSSLENSDVVLPKGMDANRDLSAELLILNQQKIKFFEIQDATLDDLSSLQDSRLRFLSLPAPSAANPSTITASSSSGLQLQLSLPSGDQTLPDLIAQEQSVAPVLDFTAFSTTQTILAKVQLAREADYDAVTGFYRTVDAHGSVRAADGSIVSPQALDYKAVALRSDNLVAPLGNLHVADNSSTPEMLVELKESDTFVAPYAIVNRNTFFAYPAANPDGLSHFRMLAKNTFGLEDQLGLGDKDFDDHIVKLSFVSVSGMS